MLVSLDWFVDFYDKLYYFFDSFKSPSKISLGVGNRYFYSQKTLESHATLFKCSESLSEDGI